MAINALTLPVSCTFKSLTVVAVAWKIWLCTEISMTMETSFKISDRKL